MKLTKKEAAKDWSGALSCGLVNKRRLFLSEPLGYYNGMYGKCPAESPQACLSLGRFEQRFELVASGDGVSGTGREVRSNRSCSLARPETPSLGGV